MNSLQIDKVEDCMNWLINGEAYTHSQSINFLIDKLGELSISMAFINNQMAIAKRLLNKAKVAAYTGFVPKEDHWTATLIKDYINSLLETEQYNYDLCERCSRTITHTIDGLITAISALKVEMQVSNKM